MSLEPRPSAWQFETSGGMGLTIEFFAATGGELVLRDPRSGQHRLQYGGVGVGVGLPFKIPRFGHLDPHHLNLKPYGRSVSVSGGPESFPNTGEVLVLDSFGKGELQLSDFIGGCLIGEASMSLGVGASVQVFLMGCNPTALKRTLEDIANLTANDLFRLPPFNAMILIAGVGAAVSAGVSATAYAGYAG